ncbi:MAG: hypothetical protein ABIO70_21835 [Pseudomonadota bacterium]
MQLNNVIVDFVDEKSKNTWFSAELPDVPRVGEGVGVGGGGFTVVDVWWNLEDNRGIVVVVVLRPLPK